jgi:hypothetical protein
MARHVEPNRRKPSRGTSFVKHTPAVVRLVEDAYPGEHQLAGSRLSVLELVRLELTGELRRDRQRSRAPLALRLLLARGGSAGVRTQTTGSSARLVEVPPGGCRAHFSFASQRRRRWSRGERRLGWRQRACDRPSQECQLLPRQLAGLPKPAGERPRPSDPNATETERLRKERPLRVDEAQSGLNLHGELASDGITEYCSDRVDLLRHPQGPASSSRGDRRRAVDQSRTNHLCPCA